MSLYSAKRTGGWREGNPEDPRTAHCALAEITGLCVSRQHSLREPGQGLLSSPGFSMVKWMNSALEGQIWVNIQLPLPAGDPQGGLRLGPWCSLTSLRAHVRLWLTWVHTNPYSSSSSSEIFRSKYPFQEGLPSTCMNTVNVVWGSWAASGLAPSIKIFLSYFWQYLHTLVIHIHLDCLAVANSALWGRDAGSTKPGIGMVSK